MEIEASKPSVSLNTVSTKELLENIKSCESSGFSSNYFFTELYARCNNSFYQKCLRLCLDNGFDEHLAKDIFQQAFLKAYKKIIFFQLEENLSEERQKNTVVAWLAEIATNEFNDYLRKRIKIEEIQESDDDEFYSEYGFEELYNLNDELQNTNIVRIREALLTLTERESYIIHQCNRYGCLEIENKNHLPEEVIKDICQQFGIKSSYIRVIKMRALLKIRSYCLS